MDRDLGKPRKSQTSTGKCAGLVIASAGLPMKQIRCARIPQRLHSTTPVFDNACPAHTTRTAASSKAHDKDGTTNKEFYR